MSKKQKKETELSAKELDALAKRSRAVARSATKSALGGITNVEYAKAPHFVKLCNARGIKPTARQASKFRNKRGKVFASVATASARAAIDEATLTLLGEEK